MKEKPAEPKTAYTTPRLVIFGDLRRLTTDKGGRMDEGGAPGTRR